MDHKPGTHERFILYRQRDITGVSDTGTVAEGIEFSDGYVAMRWCVEGKPSSVAIYESIEDMLEIHGHDGATQAIWDW